MFVQVKRQVASYTVTLGVLGVVLVLLGSIVDLPYRVRETFSNYPYNPPGTWANEVLTLRPHTNRSYSLDLLNENNSLIYLRVEEVTNLLVFMISGPLGYGFENSKTLVKLRMYSITPPESPFEYFWTPPTLGAWDFIFDNPYDTTTNVTVKILDYRYNAEWQEEVTRYHPPLHKVFAYVGIIMVIGAIIPLAYGLHKTKKETLQSRI